jgi:hypothetical protein
MDAQFRQLPDQVVHFSVFEKSLSQGDMNGGFRQKRIGRFDMKPDPFEGSRHDPGPIAASDAVEEFHGIAGRQAKYPTDMDGIRSGDLRLRVLGHFRWHKKASQGHGIAFRMPIEGRVNDSI